MIYPNPHPEGCFWHGPAELLGAPNIKWCEPTICSLFSEPANTWTNLAYILAAGLMAVLLLRKPNRTMRWFPLAVFVMGAGSFIYHASNNFLSQLGDFVGMFFWIYLILAINMRRYGFLGRGAARGVYWALVLGSSLGIWGLYLLEFPFQITIAVLALVIVASEVGLYFKSGQRAGHYSAFVLCLALLAAGEVFSLLDVNRIWCQPDNSFLHGHVLWHLLGGLATLFAFFHYRQFELDSASA